MTHLRHLWDVYNFLDGYLRGYALQKKTAPARSGAVFFAFYIFHLVRQRVRLMKNPEKPHIVMGGERTTVGKVIFHYNEAPREQGQP